MIEENKSIPVGIMYNLFMNEDFTVVIAVISDKCTSAPVIQLCGLSKQHE